MHTEIISSEHPVALNHAVDVLKNGGLVAFPTDTVYGLAADVYDEDTIERLYIVKGRSGSKAIAVLLSDLSQLDQVAVNIREHARILAETFWPGPLTIIFERHPRLPEILAPTKTIGVRVPNHPVAIELMRITGPLAVTSANQSGQENPLTAGDVFDQLKDRIHLIIDGGRVPGEVPSTVVDCTTDEIKLLRPGPISMDDLNRVLSSSR